MIKLYDHNIWGGFSKDEAIANRNSLIAQLIAEHDPDVICFQECEPLTSRAPDVDIAAMIKGTHDEAACVHTHENFTPIFYARKRMREIESGFVLFEGFNDINSKSFTWSVLEDKRDGKRFGAVSTHFWFKATGEIDENQRRENARAVASVSRELSERYGIPVIVAGDLNSCIETGQGLGGYDEMLKQGFADVRYTAPITDNSHTLHDYPRRDASGNYVAGELPDKTLDYVLTLGDGITCERFAVLTDEKSLASSDHCPLIAEFEIN